MLHGKTSLPFWTDFRFHWRASHRPKNGGSNQGFLKTVSFTTSGELPSIPGERNICCVSLQCINTALTLINSTQNRSLIHCDNDILSFSTLHTPQAICLKGGKADCAGRLEGQLSKARRNRTAVETSAHRHH